MFRSAPEPCIVCGAAFAACTHDDGRAVIIPQLPGRDGQIQAARPALVADAIQATLGPDEFTSGTYRGRRK